MLRPVLTLAPRGAARLATRAAVVKELMPAQQALAKAIQSLPENISSDKFNEFLASDPAMQATMDKLREDGDLSWTWSRLGSKPTQPAVTVAVAGAGTPAGEKALYRIAAGEMLGPDTPVTIQAAGASAAVTKDLEACEFPLLKGVSTDSSFKGAQYALLLEGDFKAMGSAIAKASPGALVGVLGSTNALAAASAASGMDASQFSSITRHVQLATEREIRTANGKSVANVIAWGSGSTVDISHATVENQWIRNALGLSEDGEGGWAVSTADVSSIPAHVVADGAVRHMKDWALGSDGKWVSMGVPSTGDYGLGTEGIFFSVPCVTSPGEYKRVGGVSLAPASAAAMEKDRVALLAEKKAANL